MRKLVLTVAAVGALAVAGGAVALVQADSNPAVAGTAEFGQVADLIISSDDTVGYTVDITGGPEGDRLLDVPTGSATQRVPGIGGHKYTLTAKKTDGTEIGEVTMPGGVKGGWDCFATDDYGPLNWGCVIGTD